MLPLSLVFTELRNAASVVRTNLVIIGSPEEVP